MKFNSVKATQLKTSKKLYHKPALQQSEKGQGEEKDMQGDTDKLPKMAHMIAGRIH